MDRDSPEPQPFDPAHSEAPALTDPTGGGGFVLLVAASGATDGDWAEQSATALARSWARQGRRILLADLSLLRPGLHRVLGVENGEGVSDTFLFGSSIQRVARPVRESGFLFVSAGTATASPEAVAASARWSAVVEGCARVQATLVVFLPSDLPGGETLLERASDVVLLTDLDATGSAALQAGLGERLRAVLTPPVAAGNGLGLETAFEEPPAAPDSDPIGAQPVAEPESELAGSAPGLATAAEASSFAVDFGDPRADEEDAEPRPLLGDWDPTPPSEPAPSFQEPAAIDVAPADPLASFGALDFDFAMPQQGEAVVEESPTFGGELSFLEPEPEPEPEPALPAGPAPAAPSWAQAGSAMNAATGGTSMRAADIPMRQADAEAPPRERPRSPRPDRPARPEPKPAQAKSRTGMLLLAVVLVIAAVVGAAWYGLVDVPYLSELLPGSGATAAPASGLVGDAPEADVLAETSDGFRLALTLDSFTDPALARLQASSLNEQRPDLLFVVAPVSVSGTVYHRLLAGPATDSAGADALRTTLAGLLTRENPADWVLRPTPLAFNLGDRNDLAAAAERVAELSRVDIPAYVLELPGRSAAGVQIRRYRVYSGAYADEREAAYLSKLLVSKGFPDARLVPRIGRNPQ